MIYIVLQCIRAIWNATLTEITFPKADKDLLMFAPSFKRSPVAPVLSALSDPAKSTRFITELFLVPPFALFDI